MKKQTADDTRKVIEVLNKILKPEKYKLVLILPLDHEYEYVDLYTTSDDGMNPRTYVKSFYVDDQHDVFNALFSSHPRSAYYSITEMCLDKTCNETEKQFCEICKRHGIENLADVLSLDELKLRLIILGNEI